MAGCEHATKARRGAGEGSDSLGPHQVQWLPGRQSVAEPRTIFTRETQGQLRFSRGLYDRSLTVQLFWSWPHILFAKALVDKIYALV